MCIVLYHVIEFSYCTPLYTSSMILLYQLLAAPFLFGTLYLKPPWAFLSLLFSYLTGEMWFAVALAVAMEMVPYDISSSGVALYLFVINIIGGNINLILPPLERVVGLQLAMVLLFPGSYIAASVLFLIAGILWACQSSRRHGYSMSEKTRLLIQDNDYDDSDLLTESEEVMSRRQPPTKRSIAMSFTASM